MEMKKPKTTTISNVQFLVNLTSKYAPGYFFLEVLNGVLLGIFTTVDVVFIKYFYEALEREKVYTEIVKIMFMVILVMLIHQIWFQLYRNVIRPSCQQTLQARLQCHLLEHARNLDLAFYEKKDFYEKFIWAMNRSDGQISGLLQMISNTITMIISILVTTVVMMSVSITMTIFAVATSFLTVFLQRMSTKNRYHQNVEVNKIDRRLGYYERVFYAPDYAKELRLSHVSDLLISKYKVDLQNRRGIFETYNFKGLKYDFPLVLTSRLMQPIVYLVLLLQGITTGGGTIAGIAVAYSAFWNLRGRLQAIMDLSVRIAEMGLYTDIIRTFLETKSDLNVGSKTIPRIERVSSSHLDFGYTPTRKVLHDVTISIQRGKKIALVGYNGSGKTTFIKLLLHLYQPTSGSVQYNDVDVSEYDRESLISKTGIIFQDHQLYALSLAENILCDMCSAHDHEKIKSALWTVRFDLEDLHYKQGIETQLTREFDPNGVNVSGGEKQKIAIARLFAHDYDLLVLDEPSSSLDPTAEYELYRYLEEQAGDKAVIFISHRLSTTKNADYIYMFEEGHIIEKGTHKELMNADGKYAQMFRVQAEKYAIKRD